MALDDRGAPPFKPTIVANTVNIAFVAASASANVALPTTTPQGATLRVFNNSPVVMFIDFDTSVSAAATTAVSYPVLPNTIEIIRIPDGKTYTYVAAIPAASTTGTVYFTPGSGV